MPSQLVVHIADAPDAADTRQDGTGLRCEDCDGDDIPPHLIWSGAPKQAKSFVLIMDDPDAPNTFTHWLVFDIPAERNDLPSGTRSDAVGLSGRNSDIAIIVGGSRNHLTHEVPDPVALQVDLTADEAERALIIHGSDGTTTTIASRSAMWPEEVDGLPASDRR